METTKTFKNLIETNSNLNLAGNKIYSYNVHVATLVNKPTQNELANTYGFNTSGIYLVLNYGKNFLQRFYEGTPPKYLREHWLHINQITKTLRLKLKY